MWRDSETNIDYLDFNYLVEVLNKIILNEELTPASIGVFGYWGSGKSSLISMSYNMMIKDKKNLCIKFNSWLFESYEDAKTTLMINILNEIENKIKNDKELYSKVKDKIVDLYKKINKMKLAKYALIGGIGLATGGAGLLPALSASFLADGLAKKISSGEIERVLNDLSDISVENNVGQDILEFRVEFKKLLDETNLDRIVIYIDELDRCNYNTIIDTLEVMRLFLFSRKTIFVIGADKRHVKNAIKSKFSNLDTDYMQVGEEYLQKMIQYPINIPKLDERGVANYFSHLFYESVLTKDINTLLVSELNKIKTKNYLDFTITNDILDSILSKFIEDGSISKNKLKHLHQYTSISNDIAPLLANTLEGNPRNCKRFLNTLQIRLQMAEIRNIELDILLLTKLMLLEYCKDSLFQELYNLQLLSDGKPKEIKLIEEKKHMEVKYLSNWQNDIWIEKWCDLKPSLIDEDLKPYFYFSRDEIINSRITIELSTYGKKCLDKLTSESTTYVEQGIDDINNLQSFESIRIYEKYINKINDKDVFTPLQFRILLTFSGCNDDLKERVFKYFLSVNPRKISIGFQLHIELARNIYKQRFDEIHEKWLNESKKYKKEFIKNESGGE